LGGAWHRRGDECLADRQSIGQPQGTLAQPFDKLGGDPIAQTSLDEAEGEEEGDDEEPDDLVGEGGEGAGEGQGFSDDGGGEAEEGPSSDGQGAEDEAGDGGDENGEQLPCLGRDFEGFGDEELDNEGDGD
jgi:hypothetical protein